MSIINDALKRLDESRGEEKHTQTQTPNLSTPPYKNQRAIHAGLFGGIVVGGAILFTLIWKIAYHPIQHYTPETLHTSRTAAVKVQQKQLPSTSELTSTTSAKKVAHHPSTADVKITQQEETPVFNYSPTEQAGKVSIKQPPRAMALMSQLYLAATLHDETQFDMLVQELSTLPHWRKELGVIISQLEAGAHYETAEQLVSALQKRAPMDLSLRMKLAHLYIDNNQSKQAVQLLENKKITLEKHTAYYALLAYALMKAKDYKNSIELYQQLVSIDSTEATWWMGLGVAYLYSGNPNEALASFERAKAHTDEHAPYRYFLSEKIHSLRGSNA